METLSPILATLAGNFVAQVVFFILALVVLGLAMILAGGSLIVSLTLPGQLFGKIARRFPLVGYLLAFLFGLSLWGLLMAWLAKTLGHAFAMSIFVVPIICVYISVGFSIGRKS